MFPTGDWPNIWLGTTCEDQEHYDRRWPILAAIPARVRFISYEPALGPLSIRKTDPLPDWIICGGESESGARMMDPTWARDLRDQCAELGIAFFMKQMTRKAPIPDDLMVRQFPTRRTIMRNRTQILELEKKLAAEAAYNALNPDDSDAVIAAIVAEYLITKRKTCLFQLGICDKATLQRLSIRIETSDRDEAKQWLVEALLRGTSFIALASAARRLFGSATAAAG